jgi:hypothetical protein
MTKIEEILIEFQSEGITPAAIERALDLNQDSLTISNLIDDPETIALLKIIRTYPWLLEVVEKRYDQNEAKRILLHHTIDQMINEKVNKEKS